MIAVAACLGLQREQIEPAGCCSPARTSPRRARSRAGPRAAGAGPELDDGVGRLPDAGERPERRAGERQLFHETSFMNIGCSRPPSVFGQHMLIQPWAASAFMNARELAPEP